MSFLFPARRSTGAARGDAIVLRLLGVAGFLLAVAAPAAAVPEGFRPVTIVLRSGELVRGTLVEETEEHVVVDRGGARGPFYDPLRTLPRSEIETIAPPDYRPPEWESSRAFRHVVPYAGGGVASLRSRDSPGGGWGTGTGGELGLLFATVPRLHLRLGGGLRFSRYPSEEEGLTDYTLFDTELSGRVGPLGPAAIAPYGLLAIGSGSISFDRPADFPHPASSSGLTLGIGLGADVLRGGPVEVYVEGRAESVLLELGSDEFLGLSLGLRFPFRSSRPIDPPG